MQESNKTVKSYTEQGFGGVHMQLQNFLEEKIHQNALSPIDLDLMDCLQRFSNILSVYGYEVPVASKAALAKLPEVADDKKRQIIRQYDLFMDWIAPEKKPEKPEVSGGEITWAKKALQFYGLSVSDDYWATVTKDQIIEIYSDDMTQIYRSISFFTKTGYSLADLALFEWWVLWKRSNAVIEKQTAEVTEILNKNISLMPTQIPPHVVLEVMNSGETDEFEPSAISVKYHNLGSVTKLGKAAGFIVTTSCDVLVQGEDVKKIAFV